MCADAFSKKNQVRDAMIEVIALRLEAAMIAA